METITINVYWIKEDNKKILDTGLMMAEFEREMAIAEEKLNA